MPTFDVHQHLWPEQLLAALAGRRHPPRVTGRTLDLGADGRFPFDPDVHRLESRLALLDRDGTDVAVFSLQPTLGIDRLPAEEREPLVDAYHTGALELVAASGGRLRALAVEASLDGFAGACVSASAVVAGGPALSALEDALAAAERVLFVHPGPAPQPDGAPAWWPALAQYTAEMQAAYLAWLARRGDGGRQPATIFAILAGGAPIQGERLASRGLPESFARDPLAFLDVASYGRHALDLCLATVGADRLVFGSDLPVVDSGPTLQAVHSLGDPVADVVRAENATLLFG